MKNFCFGRTFSRYSEGEEDLENRKEVVGKEEEENSVEKLMKGKNQEIKNLQARIKKLMNNVEETNWENS